MLFTMMNWYYSALLIWLSLWRHSEKWGAAPERCCWFFAMWASLPIDLQCNSYQRTGTMIVVKSLDQNAIYADELVL